ncbi:MAG: multifunctional CCA addition/repair protein [Woeseiaceae bacterium]|nr:multifunctional CCA addition/repair protein [Woeseiaceae bacterium]
MEVYLVGGAVRDELLGLPVKERDWCVTGATPEEMVALGYRPVGKDFPVFLHPDTAEEYALARTERKSGRGYHGFQFDTSAGVTIEDDLERRDLTVNAMARDGDGALIDPFNGRADIEARQLRHVSDAFGEDPVRVLRAAKFAARFAGLGFNVAEETRLLMAAMVANGEVAELAPDRVWKETQAALLNNNPQVFFQVLRDCDALAVVFPEIDALFGIPQPPRWHPEIDCGVHTLMVVEQAAALSPELDVRFAALVHDLGKAKTPVEKLPAHHGHERRSVNLVRALSRRLPVPGAARDLALLVAEFHGHCHRALELKPETILKLFERCDAFRRPDRFARFLTACEADARGRTGLEDRAYPQSAYLAGALQAAAAVTADELVAKGLSGADIGRGMQAKRLAVITGYKKSQQPPQS